MSPVISQYFVQSQLVRGKKYLDRGNPISVSPEMLEIDQYVSLALRNEQKVVDISQFIQIKLPRTLPVIYSDHRPAGATDLLPSHFCHHNFLHSTTSRSV